MNLRTGRPLALLDTNLFTWVQDDSGGMNHISLETCWSADGSVLGWVLGGKWSPAAFTLVKVRSDAVAWQLDVEAAVQKAILERTRKAAPANYAAAVKQNAGSGRAFPEGFTVDMDVPQAGFSLPWKGHATLDSNPKDIADGWPAQANVAASLNFIVQPDGTIVFLELRPRSQPDRRPTRRAVTVRRFQNDERTSPSDIPVATSFATAKIAANFPMMNRGAMHAGHAGRGDTTFSFTLPKDSP